MAAYEIDDSCSPPNEFAHLPPTQPLTHYLFSYLPITGLHVKRIEIVSLWRMEYEWAVNPISPLDFLLFPPVQPLEA